MNIPNNTFEYTPLDNEGPSGFRPLNILPGTQTFQYTPLDDEGQSGFRLLNILPGKEDSPISCTLDNISWSEEDEQSTPSQPRDRRLRRMVGSLKSRLGLRGRKSPAEELNDKTPRPEHHPVAYNALSYTWGIEMADRQILVNEQPFAVSPTLESAICHLRTEDQPFPVWIDAICIDQEAGSEKVNQIKKMHRIYGNAQRVIAWLGESDGASDAAFAFAKWLSESITDAERRELHAYQIIFPPSLRRFLYPANIDFFSAVNMLVGRSYWRRAWIVQEFVVAKSVLVQCGKASIPWHKLQRAIILANCAPYIFTTVCGGRTSDPVDAQAVVNLCRARTNYHVASNPHTVFDSSRRMIQDLDNNRTRLCKLDHDRIFSSLALMPKAFVDRIRIDYSQTVEELFKSVVPAFFEAYGCLDILAQSNHSVWNTGLPSWVPDWRREGRVCMFIEPKFKPKKRPYALFSSDLSQLSVKGSKIATVLETHCECDLLPSLKKRDCSEDDRGRPVPNVDGICGWRLTPLRTQEELADILFPALYRWNSEILLPFPGLPNVFLKLLQAKRDPASFDEWSWWLKTKFPRRAPSLPDWENKAWHDLEKTLSNLLLSRTIVATADFLAIAPDFSQPGDEIYWIEGCSALILLRPTGNGDYKFLGDVFVGSQRNKEDTLVPDFNKTGSRTFEIITLV